MHVLVRLPSPSHGNIHSGSSCSFAALASSSTLVYGYNKRVRHAHARAWRRCARRCGWYGVDAVEAGGVLAQEAGSGAGSPGDDSGGRRGVAMAAQHVHVRGGGSLQEHDEHCAWRGASAWPYDKAAAAAAADAERIRLAEEK